MKNKKDKYVFLVFSMFICRISCLAELRMFDGLGQAQFSVTGSSRKDVINQRLSLHREVSYSTVSNRSDFKIAVPLGVLLLRVLRIFRALLPALIPH